MYQSLKATSKDFHLYIFTFDDHSYQILNLLCLEFVTLIDLKSFETPELLEVKKIRTKAEYCWTCTPAVISHSINKFNLSECTYLDSDLFFFSDPDVLISEMKKNDKRILITEHKYALLPKLHGLNRAGRFCVQFLTISNEKESILVLETWRNQCLEWCYAKYEDGKFGDQKYLDEWPEKYSGIHILEHEGGGIAPWNINNYHLSFEKDKFFVENKKTGKKDNLIFFHFQYIKPLGDGLFDLGWYYLKRRIIRLLYIPYLKKINEIEDELIKTNKDYFTKKFRADRSGIKNYFKYLFKLVTGYNILKIQ